MSTQNVPVYNKYLGNGVANQFSVGFPYLDRKYVKVYLKRKDSDNEEVLESNRYAFANDQTIQFPVRPTDKILREGDVLTIQRETELGSNYEFDNQRRLFPVEAMKADDLGFQQIQELARDMNRAVKVPPTGVETGEEFYYEFVEQVKQTADNADRAGVSADNAEASAIRSEKAAQEAEGIVNGFDAHAAEKQKDFDRNYNDKLVSFNINAVDKQNAFDVNAATLTARYDNNDLAKTKAFNQNAQDMTDGFNTNAMLKVDDFDAHAAVKEMEFDDNAAIKQAQVDASADKAAVDAEEARLWAVGTIEENPEGSSKYFRDQAAAIVGAGIIQDNVISKTTTYSSDKLEKHFAVNEDHDSVLNCLDVLNDTIGEKTTVPLSSLQAIDADSRPSHKAPGAEVYDEFGTMGIIDSVTASDAIITTMESREKVRIVDTLDIQKNGLDQYYVALTANEIRNEVNKGKIVQLRFDDVITNTGEQLYPFETMDKQGYAVFRRNIITKDKAERINIKVDYQGIVTFETAELNALLKSGGSMSGALKFDNSGYIEANNSSATKGLALFGSKDGYGKGASLSLRDNTATGVQAGVFKLETGNNVTGHTHTLQGNPNGTIQWDNKELANKDFITSKITNCITEIPQDIKFELKDGYLVLKAGSKLYVPNGVGKFDVIVTSSDYNTSSESYAGNSDVVLFADVANNNILRIYSEIISKCFSGDNTPTLSTSIATWYDTKENKIKRTTDAGATWLGTKSLPLCVSYRNNGKHSSTGQVFNGFGYIGSTIFALPNVKGLIPNGRNADGSLKSIEFTVNKVLTQTSTGSARIANLFITASSLNTPDISISNYDSEVNEVQYNKKNAFACIAGETTYDNSRITSFNPKQAFHAVDYNDFEKLDNNAVRKSGEEIIDGHKIFTDTITKKSEEIDKDITPSQNQFSYMNFYDKNDKRLGIVGVAKRSNGALATYLQTDPVANGGRVGNLSLYTTSQGTAFATCPTPSPDVTGDEITTAKWVRAQSPISLTPNWNAKVDLDLSKPYTAPKVGWIILGKANAGDVIAYINGIPINFGTGTHSYTKDGGIQILINAGDVVSLKNNYNNGYDYKYFVPIRG